MFCFCNGVWPLFNKRLLAYLCAGKCNGTFSGWTRRATDWDWGQVELGRVYELRRHAALEDQWRHSTSTSRCQHPVTSLLHQPHRSVVVGMLNLWSRGRGFNSRSGRYQVGTVAGGKIERAIAPLDLGLSENCHKFILIGKCLSKCEIWGW